MRSPDYVYCSCSHFRVAAHDGHASGKRAVNAEHDKLCAARQHGQVTVSRCVVAPLDREDVVHSLKIHPLMCRIIVHLWLTWPPFWPDTLRCSAVCCPESRRKFGRCYWLDLCWSTPTLRMEAGSLCGCQPWKEHKKMNEMNMKKWNWIRWE